MILKIVNIIMKS